MFMGIKKQRLLVMTLVIAMVITLIGCTTKGPSDSSALFKAGTYATEVDGYGGKIKVETTFSDNEIVKIEIVENSETVGIGSTAIDKIPSDIVESQSLGVDAVSGATVTSAAIIEAVSKAVEEAGGDVKSLKEAPINKSEGEAVIKETDVVVIGGGGAGLAAAVSAADNGAKVILVEKTAALGGNTVRAGGPYNAVDPERQANVKPADEASMAKAWDLVNVEPKSERHAELMEELKADLEAYENGTKDNLFDSLALHKLQTYAGGDYDGKLEFVEKLVEESLPTSEWMAENGVQWTDEITTVPGGLWPRAHLPVNAAGYDYIKASEDTARELGVEILLNSPATELIIEDGTVVGIKGESNGQDMEIRAKVVIIATGGFAANIEMRQEYVPSLTENLPTTNSPAIVGDGIKMAEAANANLIGMKYIQSLPLGNPKDGTLNGWIGGAGVEYYYQVNQEGKRFMAEDGRRDTMTAALLDQTNAMSYVISSANNDVDINETGENIWGDNVDKLVEDGIIFRADTIEELAEQIGIDPQVLRETHDTFNSYVAAGKDKDFGRSLFGKPLDKAPFYASPRVPTVHHTMGGLEIDLETHVLDKNGDRIPGLLAAGEVTGGIHGTNRLGGNALVDIHVFGKTAGEVAAKIVSESK
ncbi:MAG: flavocytochrome c [Tissierellaceae bacterium]|nr:flavocytochrome c [Tissierellaceae bacterium]